MRLFLLLGLVGAIGATDANAQQFYKWKDANGVTHYTETPPPKEFQAQKLAVDTTPPSSADPAAAGTAPGTDSGAESTAAGGLPASAKQQRDAACTVARSNLETLLNSPFVSMDKDGDGKPELLTTAEQSAQIARARQQVAACSSEGTPPAG